MTDNPFITNGYAGADFFCDRIDETKMLTELLTNGNNVALISPRRLGKTDLIRHCFDQDNIKRNYHTFLIDIYATESLYDFVHLFSKAILDSLKPKGRRVWEQFLGVVKSLKAEVSFDINGLPSFGVGIGTLVPPENTLDEIFEYLQSSDLHCLVAIDEFQQITHYADSRIIEATLRTYIQRCSNANFVFSGSKRHLMGEIFVSAARPFYQSVTVMNLQKIPLEKYCPFAQQLFAAYGQKEIDSKVVEDVYKRFDGITAYMQKVMNLLYTRTKENEKCEIDMVESVIDDYLQLSSDTYEALLRQLPEKHRMVLYAIAAEDKATMISGSTFVRKYRLPSASSVISAAKGLLDKDIITREGDTYYIYDPFFLMWIRSRL